MKTPMMMVVVEGRWEVPGETESRKTLSSIAITKQAETRA